VRTSLKRQAITTDTRTLNNSTLRRAARRRRRTWHTVHRPLRPHPALGHRHPRHRLDRGLAAAFAAGRDRRRAVPRRQPDYAGDLRALGRLGTEGRTARSGSRRAGQRCAHNDADRLTTSRSALYSVIPVAAAMWPALSVSAHRTVLDGSARVVRQSALRRSFWTSRGFPWPVTSPRLMWMFCAGFDVVAEGLAPAELESHSSGCGGGVPARA
jgi:hypothetical protein